MINPSINGWIDKYFLEQKLLLLVTENQPDLFYKKVRETGFIYGHIVSFNTAVPILTKGWLENEVSKVALLTTLYGIYRLTTDENNPDKFVLNAVSFYNEMNPQGFNLFKKVMPDSSTSSNLEK